MMKRTGLSLALLGLLAITGCGNDAAKPSPLLDAAKACHDSEVACPRPILGVRNLAASQRYYRDALGFKVDWEYGEPPDFGSVSRGDGVLFLAQTDEHISGSWVFLFTRDVDRLHEELARKKAI